MNQHHISILSYFIARPSVTAGTRRGASTAIRRAITPSPDETLTGFPESLIEEDLEIRPIDDAPRSPRLSTTDEPESADTGEGVVPDDASMEIDNDEIPSRSLPPVSADVKLALDRQGYRILDPVQRAGFLRSNKHKSYSYSEPPLSYILSLLPHLRRPEHQHLPHIAEGNPIPPEVVRLYENESEPESEGESVALIDPIRALQGYQTDTAEESDKKKGKDAPRPTPGSANVDPGVLTDVTSSEPSSETVNQNAGSNPRYDIDVPNNEAPPIQSSSRTSAQSNNEVRFACQDIREREASRPPAAQQDSIVVPSRPAQRLELSQIVRRPFIHHEGPAAWGSRGEVVHDASGRRDPLLGHIQSTGHGSSSTSLTRESLNALRPPANPTAQDRTVPEDADLNSSIYQRCGYLHPGSRNEGTPLAAPWSPTWDPVEQIFRPEG